MIIDEIINETNSVDLKHSFILRMDALKYINSLSRDGDGNPVNAILERTLAHRNMIEVMTFAGFDPQKTGKMNDFYGLEFLIIPAVYADVTVATDKWIRNLMKSYGRELH